MTPQQKAMKKETGELQMFKEIWEERPHVSELSGKPLLPIGHFQWHWQFLHVLPKGSYPHYKLKKENIVLGTVNVISCLKGVRKTHKDHTWHYEK